MSGTRARKAARTLFPVRFNPHELAAVRQAAGRARMSANAFIVLAAVRAARAGPKIDAGGELAGVVLAWAAALLGRPQQSQPSSASEGKVSYEAQ